MPRTRESSRALWVLPLVAGAVLALLVALLAARVGYAGTVLSDVYYTLEWKTADRPLVGGADLGYTTKNYVRLAVYTAEPLTSLRIGTLTLPVARAGEDFDTVGGAVYRYPASGKDAVAVLRPGKNTVTVSARGARLTESLKFTVTYVATPVEEAEYYVADVGAIRQVTAFDKSLQFSTLAGTIALDGSQPATDQSVRWVVYEPPAERGDLPGGFRPVSKVFGLVFGDDDYVLSAEPTLVLKYDPIVSPTTASQMVTVFASEEPYDFEEDPDNEVSNLGGVVDTRNGTVTVKLDRSCGDRYYGVFLGIQNFEEFLNSPTDVAWSAVYVMPLWARGIMEAIQSSGNVWGYTVPGGGYFGLVQSSAADASQVEISRGEFTVMMAKVMGYRPVAMDHTNANEYSFEDVYGDFTSDSDRKKYGVWIETAARNGLVNGFPPDSPGDRPDFKMREKLPREQAAAILARAAGLTLSDDRNAVDTALARAFTDADKISPWARPYVLAAYRAKYIEGVPETTAEGKTTYKFEPERDLTRAEAAKLVYFMAKKNKKL